MINCPKCQVPNPDNATVCAACGSTLAGQQFAQALDQAQQQMGQPAPPPVPQVPPVPPQAGPAGAAPQAPPMVPAAPVAPGQVMPGGFPGYAPPPGPVGAPLDPAQAQEEINKFLAEQKSRKRTKTIIYSAVVLAIAGVIGFIWLQSARKDRRKRDAVEFFSAWRQVDDEQVAKFWQCTVRAKSRDVRLAADTLEITEGLSKAFSNFPSSQPDFIKNKCITMIPSIIEDLGKLRPPAGFERPLEENKAALGEVKSVFMTYADKIAQRKDEAILEQEIRNANQDFHIAQEQQDVKLALPYFNLIKCAVPDLMKKVRAITKPPDTQAVVEYIYHTCKKDSALADKIRKECYSEWKKEKKKTDDYRVAVYRMSGDNRDLEALNFCFKRANRGFDQAELEAVAKVFIKYRKARGEILTQMGVVKEELAD